MTEHNIEIEQVDISDKEVLRRLLEFYVYDFSEYMGWDVDMHGSFGYRYLDHYWTDLERHPFFIRVDGRLAGFAMVRRGDPHDMVEFFVMRNYRRKRIGQVAARLVLTSFPGAWEVRQMAENTGATTFWRSAIPVTFSEELREGRPVQCFVVPR